MPFIGTFGFKCGRDINKMTQCQYKIGETGVPLVLDHALAVIEAKVIDIIPVYTHKLFVAEVVSAETIKAVRPDVCQLSFDKGESRPRMRRPLSSTKRNYEINGVPFCLRVK